MVVHPPSTSQRQLAEAELLEAGITPGLLRVSVGLEDVEDLEADFADALAAARGGPRRASTPGRRLGARPSRHRRPSRPPRPARPGRTPSPALGRGPVAPADLGRLRGRPDHRRWPSLAVVGMTIRQLPDFAFRSAGDYATAMDEHPRPLRPAPGRRARRRARAAERLLDLPLGLVQRRPDDPGHLDRRLHARPHAQAVARRRRRPGRPAGALLRPAAPRPGRDDRRRRPTACAAVLRRHRFKVREATAEDGPTYLYGDRHQYTKMATLLTHTGPGPVPGRRGRDRRGWATSRGWSCPEGESLTVQPIGTPGLLLVKNLDFEAPGFETGQAVGLHDRPRRLPETARRSRARPSGSTTRSSIAGYTFHQNGFGPAPYLVDPRRGRASRCGTGRSPMTDAADGLAVRDHVRPGSRHRPAAAARQDATTASGRSCSCCRTGSRARTPTATPIVAELRRRSRSARGDTRVAATSSASPSSSGASASTRC